MDKYISFFEDYISSFDLSDINLKRKYNHTYRVVDLSEKISKSLNLSDREVFLAKIIALFHDVGRFKQYKEFHKYNDIGTMNHAEASVKCLNETGIIDDLEEKDIVLKAIFNHNKFMLDDSLNKEELLFCKIIRDADKIDILKLVIQGEIKMNDYEEEYSEEAVNDLINGKCIDLGKYPRKVDQSLVKIGLVNDINFNYSKEYILNNKIIDKLIDIYKVKNKKEENKLVELRIKMKERLSDKTC